MSAVPFFYDQQIRRYLLQFMRLFSNYQVEFGKDRNGTVIYKTVPCKYGDSSRNVASILRNNSENIMGNIPQISCYITGLTYARDRVQEPNFVSKMNIRERRWDPVNEIYESTQGNAFTIERLMPVPYTLTVKADIWVSNTEQRLQLLEQILCLFNPSLEIQSTDNYIDWTSLSLVTLTDTNFTSRTVPVGTDDTLDVSTLTFEIPIWISAPAKIKKLGVIQSIVAGIYDAQGNLETENIDDWLLLGNRPYVTPTMNGVMLQGNQLILLKYEDIAQNKDNPAKPLNKIGTKDNWGALVNLYGKLTNGISQVKLLQSDGETYVTGYVAYHPTDDTILLFTVDGDTIPVNTLDPIAAVIDPLKVGPGDGLASALTGTRYILTNDIGAAGNADGADAWKGLDNSDLIAHANDIIEFDGNAWNVIFDSQETTSIEYVSNLTTGLQYKWTGSRWIRSFEGEYKAGKWSLVL
jgi:hypothetical protein